jgi:hypothetical protein
VNHAVSAGCQASTEQALSALGFLLGKCPHELGTSQVLQSPLSLRNVSLGESEA